MLFDGFACNRRSQLQAHTGSSGLRFVSSKAADLYSLFHARGSPLWDECEAQSDDAVHGEPDWVLAAQPAADYEVDRLANWWWSEAAISMRCGVARRLH